MPQLLAAVVARTVTDSAAVLETGQQLEEDLHSEYATLSPSRSPRTILTRNSTFRSLVFP